MVLLICSRNKNLKSISTTAQDDKNEEIDAQVTNMINQTGGGSIQKSGTKQIIFQGSKKLAFGVELYELKYDTKDQRLMPHTVKDPFTVRGSPPSFVGEYESMFFEVKYASD